MSLHLYDAAVVAKLKKWTDKTELQIYDPNETRRMFEVMSDKDNDAAIKLPIICIKRQGGFKVVNTSKQPTVFDGFTRAANIAKSTQLNMVPILITYQIDIYTRYLQEADEYTRNLVFNIINYPLLSVEIPYQKTSIVHNSSLQLLDEVEDNSDIPERLIPGQFSRMSIGVTVDDAFLWDVRTRDNYSIVVNVEE